MNKPSPAIIAQSAVRRLPRLALWLFCIAYVLPGFLGRSPWKNEDIAAFGVMRELASTAANWLQPQLLGRATEFDALAPYWLGAIAIKWLPFLDSALAVRIPFVMLLALTLLATWYAVYYLARSPQAQPVAFAFGGEASPVDYARAIADAGLLALIACLGLAQLSHETTPALAQLGFTALAFYAMAASPYRRATNIVGPALGLLVGLGGLALSGAPTLALLFGVGGALVEWTHMRWGAGQADPEARQQSWHWVVLITAITLGVAALVYWLDLWRWRIDLPGADEPTIWKDLRSLGRLLLWFTWPAWPLAMWTLFRWRRQLASRHVALPLWFAAMAVAATLTTAASDRSLLLSLPPLAALAAFALPTLKRSVASLIDWFTLLFFTGCGIIIWVVWIAQYMRLVHADINCFPVPEGVADAQALFLSDAAPTGFMGADFCSIEPGDTVAVWGCGGVGLMAQKSAFLLGAGRVIAIDRFPERLQMARDQVGSETLDYTACDVLDALKDMTGGRGPDACIDAVGMEAHGEGMEYAFDRVKQMLHLHTDRGEALRQAILSCRKGGTLSILGVYGLMDKFPIGTIMNKGLTVRTAQQHGQRYLPRLLEHAQRGELDPSFLATHRFSLEDGPRAYEMFKNKEDGLVRAVFEP